MKQSIILKTVIAFTIFCTLNSCETFTDVNAPQTQLPGRAVYENVNTATSAISDIYARVRDVGIVSGSFDGLTGLMSNYSDELTFYGSNTDLEAFYNHSVIPSNSNVSAMWSSSYSQIYAVNAFLEGLEASQAINQADKDKLKGEALFLRSYIHFFLLNIFGDIPYVMSTDYSVNKAVSRMPQEEVWRKIKVDLQTAEVLIPNEYPTIERIRPNKAVVKSMLARVALYTEDWAAAESYATSVIENSIYVWEPNPANEFLKDNRAIIWELHPGRTGFNTLDAKMFVSSLTPPIKSTMSVEFVNSFESGDVRRTAWVRTVTNGSKSWYQPYKYKLTGVTTPSKEYTILFRLAELYLIRAEARIHSNNKNGAAQDINKIRTRAGLLPTVASDEATLLKLVFQERKFELFTEQGHRWLDLKRTGQAGVILTPIKPNWKATQILLPLPEAELLLNRNLLPQNPGY